MGVSDNTSDEFGCGADEAFDQSQGTGWSPFNPDSPVPGDPDTGDPQVTVRAARGGRRQRVPDRPVGHLRRRRHGDDARVPRRDVDGRDDVPHRGRRPRRARVHLRRDRRSSTSACRRATPAATVRYVRITLLSPLATIPATRAGATSTSRSSRSSASANALPTRLARGQQRRARGRRADHVRRDGGSTDPDSAITGYDWDFDGNGSGRPDHHGGDDELRLSAAGPVQRAGRGQGRPRRLGHGDPDRHRLGGRRPTAAPHPAPPPPPPPARPSLSVPATGTGGAIRPRVRCAQRCTLRATFTVSRKTTRKLKLRKRTIATFRRTLARRLQPARAAAALAQAPHRGPPCGHQDAARHADRAGARRRRALAEREARGQDPRALRRRVRSRRPGPDRRERNRVT